MNTTRRVIQRRLAAIFGADVAGYVRLMETDEVGTLCLLNGHREIMGRQIVQYGGRTANTAGDGILVEFPSAVEALQCALGIQERIAAVNEVVPDERKVIFRIGLHVGEVLIRDGDMFGEGVNIAARMEKLAEPGTVCLSGVAYSYAHRGLSLSFVYLGPQLVKNHTSPIEAYLVRPSHGVLWRGLPPVHRRSEFNLGRRFHRVLTEAISEITAPEGLTAVEPAVLASLHDAPEIDEHRLAERIGIGLHSVQRMVRHLEARGLVRGAHEVSIRRRLFRLTPAGLELFDRLDPAILAVRDRVMASLSESERETLQDLLARVVSVNELKRSRRFDGVNRTRNGGQCRGYFERITKKKPTSGPARGHVVARPRAPPE